MHVCATRQKDAQGKTYKEGPLRFGESHGDFTHYKPQYLLEGNHERGGGTRVICETWALQAAVIPAKSLS
jgi:hypothetical protein